MARFEREAHFYPALKRHFARQGYKVYAELPAPHGGYMDLLAVKDDRTLAVELKIRFSRLALRQASRNKRFVWQSLVAVPSPFVLDKRTRSLFVRRGVGLLTVTGDEVTCLLPAKEAAPGYSVREVFGRHLEGNVASLYEDATGGTPTVERVSAYREFATRVRAAIVARGGVASTEQVLEDTLGWNYFRGRRAGLAALLRARFQMVAPDLWATPERARPAVHVVRMESVVRAQDRALKVILSDSEPEAHSGDIVWFVANGKIVARALLRFAGRYPVKNTPQRELRAGPAVFFPWRLTGAVPPEVIVAGLTAYRDLRKARTFKGELKGSWQTLRKR
jgi:hypothetical protein